MGASRFVLLLLCFTLSGLAALVYQTAWSQELTLAFGASQPAVTAVLAATMAGLALGAMVAGRLEYRIARPLFTYALLEAGVGVAALLVPPSVRLAGAVQRAFFAGRAEDGAAATGFYLLASLLILLPANALMGATLPLVARRAVRVATELGPRVAALYAANTVGAASGALLCAFVLIPRLGLGAAMAAGVALSFLTCALALLLARGEEPKHAPVGARVAPGTARIPGGWVLPAILVSGAISFSYEIVWTRLLSHLLGGSLYAFGTMLATFLVGLALGSAVASRWATSPQSARRAFAGAQLLAAAATLLAVAAIDHLPALLTSLTTSGEGLRPAGVLVAAGLMLPGALAIGATFPLAVRVLARDASDAGSASARVLSWNTLGSIVGALATSFLLLPKLGFAGTVALAIAAHLVLAAVAAWVDRPRGLVAGALVAALGWVLVVAPPRTPWQVLRSAPTQQGPIAGEVAFYAVGQSATVLMLDTGDSWRLSTDGMPEATILPPGARRGRQPITTWLSLLPVAARPQARSMLMIGLGGGSSLERIPASIETITVVELEREVVAANQTVAQQRHIDPLADPRIELVVNDARSFLRLTERRFDIIVSQPSHPWTSGASHLFTRELFELARDRLEPGGVLVQWIGLNLVDVETLSSLVATLGATFAEVETFCPPAGLAALFLASDEPLGLDLAAANRAVAAAPTWRELGVLNGDALLLARVLDSAGGSRLARGAPLNTDRRNLLESRSPWLLWRPLARSLAEIEGAWGPFDPLPTTTGADLLYVTARLLQDGKRDRALRVATAIESPALRETAFGLAALARGDGRRGQEELIRLVNAYPGERAPRHALIRAWQRRLSGSLEAANMASLWDGDEAAAAVVEGWRRLATGRPAEVAELEARLASLNSRDLLFPAAARLRIAWRQAAAEPTRAREALALLDPLLAVNAPIQELLVRARLGHAAEDSAVVVASLAEIANAAEGHEQLAPVAREALAILDEHDWDRPKIAVEWLREKLEGAAQPKAKPRKG